MAFGPRRPFNDLPHLPPHADTETRAILRRCIAARAALAELHVTTALIPDQAILVNAISLLEAQASSEIESIVTTADRLFRHASSASGRTDPATSEVLRCHAALHRGFEMLNRRPVSTAIAVEVCRTIRGVALDIRRTPGTALAGHATGAVLYTPPAGEDVLRRRLANWEHYMHAPGDIDPLIRLAVMHYQFEAIHPFIDGNGRTGQVLNLLYLVDHGLLDVPVLFLSRHIIRNRAQYCQRLLAVTTSQDWEAWILFMLEAVRTGAEWTTAKIHAIRALLAETSAAIRQQLPKVWSRELAKLIFAHPCWRISDVVAADIVKRQTAAVYLKTLAAKGFLEEHRAGRENLYINRPIAALLSKGT